MKSSELREKYLAFFESKGCKRVPSSSLVPDDPSLLLTSAGMVQFKPYFLQQKQLEAPYTGTTTVQKCVRTTDIDIIGTTGRHLSFFEMLGNFSFGSYFKEEMCAWAYEFSTEILKFDPERLYYTVFLDDDETVAIWKRLGVPENRIYRLGEEDNFWRAGPTGPCGPCTELYYDQGEEFSCGALDCSPGCDCDRFIEYWNCVFTQYDSQEDGTLIALPKKNIDTGMGLERTAALLQGVKSNYETDILRGLIAVAERLSGRVYAGIIRNAAHKSDNSATEQTQIDTSMRIIADHSRAVTFMIADGILPSNEGRGYVLRRLMRRAIRHGHLLGIESPFLDSFVTEVIAEMGAVYPELIENRELIERIILTEEDRFARTLRQGQLYLDQHLDEVREHGSSTLAGAVAFELHDRFGFPIDLTVEIAGEHGVEVDREEFELHMTQQRERARAHAKDDAWGSTDAVYRNLLNEYGATQFVGYTSNESTAQVLALVVDGEQVSQIQNGQTAHVVLDRTPFYGEMGGQVGDSGELILVASGTQSTNSMADFAVLAVSDTKVFEKAIYAHVGCVDGTISVGDMVCARIDEMRRERIQRNHTATHLLHYALRTILGDHVKQAGSLVAPHYLRFDFTHFEQVTRKQLKQIEDLVNTLIMEDAIVSSYETSLDEARAAGVTALFGEQYGELVRVLEVGAASRELCGGTHVSHTAQIGFLKITSESSIGATMRRIEAVTSFDALEYVNRLEDNLRTAADLFKAQPLEVSEKIESLQKRVRELEAVMRQQRATRAVDEVGSLSKDILDVGYPLVVARVDGHGIDELRKLSDLLRKQRSEGSGGAAAVILGTITPADTPMLLAAGLPEAVSAGFDAAAIIKHIAPAIQGGGGGKAAMAQAGGKDPAGLDTALEMARDFLLANAS